MVLIERRSGRVKGRLSMCQVEIRKISKKMFFVLHMLCTELCVYELCERIKLEKIAEIKVMDGLHYPVPSCFMVAPETNLCQVLGRFCDCKTYCLRFSHSAGGRNSLTLIYRLGLRHNLIGATAGYAKTTI